MKRAVAFDVGTHTIGVAQSDTLKFMAQPVKTFRYQENQWNNALIDIFKVIDVKTIDVCIIGFPKMMNNTIGESAERSKRFEKKLKRFLEKVEKTADIKVVLSDERLTTVQAEKILIAADMNRAKRKTVIDTVAAVLILEDYLNSIKTNK